MASDRQELDSARTDPIPDADDIRAHLARVLATPAFRRAPRMQRFLTFLVDELLAGRSEQLKEYTIAIGVFDKPADFDPGTSAVIRVEAGRLRRILNQYRTEAGGDESIVLEIPKGSYIPVFRRTVRSDSDSAAKHMVEPEPIWTASDERRLVTVMSCAFGDERRGAACSIASDFLSAFDLFHSLCSTITARHGGTVDGGASDRVIVYFGWPEALEDATGRAMTAALETLAAVREGLGGDGLGVRIGIATSEVVIRAELERLPLVVGPAPLLATAMLQQAPLNGVLVAEQTRRLAGNAFDFVPAGSIEGLDGDPALLWRLIGARASTTRFQAQHGTNENPIIGRREELALLESRWRLSFEGEGQTVLIVGEAGIGKSMLAEAALGGAAKGAVLRMQCSPHHVNSTLYPFVELLKALVPLGDDDGENDTRLAQFLTAFGLDGAQERALLGALLSRPDAIDLALISAARQKDLTLDLLARWLRAQVARQPSLLLVEDLHWADPTTLELLQEIAGHAVGLSLMLVLTSRHEVGDPFTRQTNLTSLRLARLPKSDSNALISQRAGAALLSSSTRDAILDRAEGIPLFIEELTRLFLGADAQRARGPQVPASLSDLLASQLGRLGSTRGVAQIAAVIGRQFSREMLELVTDASADDVEAALDRLSAAGIIVRSGPGGGNDYLFRHALLRDAAYDSILDHRRRQLHSQVAGIFIESFPDIAAEHPELVAGHLTDAAEYGEALAFWVDAGAKAAGRYALAEAIADYRRALDVLEQLPASLANSERELELVIALGQVVRSAHGYGDEELLAIYERARALATDLGDRAQLANAVYGLWTHAAGRGRWPAAVAIAAEFESLTQHAEDTQLHAEAYRLLGASAAFRGDLPLALHHFDRAMELYDIHRHGPGYGFDPGAASAAYLAWVQWHMGDPESARENAERALAIAEAKGHAPTLAMVLSWLMFHAVCEGDLETVAAYNVRLQTVCAERDCRYWQPFGSACAEWAAFETDGDKRHLDRLLAFTGEFRERYFTSCLLLLGATMCLVDRIPERGLELAEQARRFIIDHDERVWESECDRVTAELLLALPQPDAAKARQLLKRAAKTARRQGAVALERRAVERLEILEQASTSGVAAGTLH